MMEREPSGVKSLGRGGACPGHGKVQREKGIPMLIFFSCHFFYFFLFGRPLKKGFVSGCTIEESPSIYENLFHKRIEREKA